MKFQEILSRPKIAQALGFAIAKHGNQKYGKNPYSVHLLRVAEIMYEVAPAGHSLTDDVISAALLHDSLEDTNTTEEEILGMFGENVLDIVKACTKTDDDLCRKCAFKKTVKLLKASYWGVPVKLADRLANMEFSLQENSPQMKMYVKEYSEFKSLLYVQGEFEPFWAKLDEVFEKMCEARLKEAGKLPESSLNWLDGQ